MEQEHNFLMNGGNTLNRDQRTGNGGETMFELREKILNKWKRD